MLDNTKNWKDKMQALKNHASPIDLPLEWDALENRMEKRKRRKIIFWLWPLMLGMAIVSGYFLNKDINQKSTPTSLSSTKKTVVMDQKNDGLEEVKGNKQGLQKNHISTQNTSAKSWSESQQARTQNITKSSASQIQKQTKPREIQTNKDVDQQVFAIENNTTLTTLSTSIHSNNALQIDNETSQVNPNDKMEHTNAISVPFLTSIFGEVRYVNPMPHLNPQVVILQNKPKPFFIDVRMMAGLSNYKYLSQEDENIGLVNQRKNNEKALEQIGGRLSVGKAFYQQWYASVGMSYHRLNEQWQSSRLDTSALVLSEQILESYTNHLGQVVETKGAKQAKQVSAVTQTRYNTVEQLTTTIAIGKYFYIHKMRWALEANISIPIHSRFSGQAWDNSGQMTGLETIYQSFNTLQYGMHTSYIYPVSGNLALYGGYDYNFSRLKSDLGYFRTHHLHSISFGVKYFINK
jgi:hypothetical protein